MIHSTILAGCLAVIVACNGVEENKDGMVRLEDDSTAEQYTISENQGISPEKALKKDAEKAPLEDISTETSREASEMSAAGTTAYEEVVPPTAQNEQAEPITIFLSVVPDEMRFDKDVFTVTAGEEVIIELENLDGMQHNMLISKPGTLDKVGAAADVLARDPKGAAKQYVPEIEEVLFATDMLNPGDFATLKFTAPKEPGDYPFVCTFPGHWRMMNGIMKVTAP